MYIKTTFINNIHIIVQCKNNTNEYNTNMQKKLKDLISNERTTRNNIVKL